MFAGVTEEMGQSETELKEETVQGRDSKMAGKLQRNSFIGFFVLISLQVLLETFYYDLKTPSKNNPQ